MSAPTMRGDTVLVPREPTEEMVAFGAACRLALQMGSFAIAGQVGKKAAKNIWHAMIEAHETAATSACLNDAPRSLAEVERDIAVEALAAVYKNALGGDPNQMARRTADLSGDALNKIAALREGGTR